MIEIIERSFRGEASPLELAQLASWRIASPANEREYQAVLRVLRSARKLGELPAASPVPSAAELLAAPRSADRPAHARPAAEPLRLRLTAPSQAGRRLRYAPWAIAAAAVLALAVTLSRGSPATDPLAWGGEIVTTGPTELSTVRLADGSVVRWHQRASCSCCPAPAPATSYWMARRTSTWRGCPDARSGCEPATATRRCSARASSSIRGATSSSWWWSKGGWR
jgi:ferric-dicitrate binding protein FerR (iron transport regulator)